MTDILFKFSLFFLNSCKVHPYLLFPPVVRLKTVSDEMLLF